MPIKRINPVRSVLAPVLSGCLLVVLVAMGDLNPSPPQNVDSYFEDVAHAIDKMPYRIGHWTGSDLDSAPPQVESMLKPNRILHRGYVNDRASERVRLVIVHCPDVRDMRGHYPPNCYPATGWMPVDHRTLSVPFPDGPEDISVYSFSRSGERGTTQIVTVAVFFAMPGTDREVYADLSSVRRASENRRRNLLGSAQLQIIFDGVRSDEAIIEVVKTFAPALEPVIQTVAEGLE
ncbi:MAG TPA: exosortase-associated EpsI family protein [Phycisphaerales bacterium]|nr:exosortase-associated EpsI family protein [Phycisphaerales bacterium]